MNAMRWKCEVLRVEWRREYVCTYVTYQGSQQIGDDAVRLSLYSRSYGKFERRWWTEGDGPV